MIYHVALERYFWFEDQVKRGHYPNAARLAQKFEISHRTATRHIEYMRDRLHAPLKYEHRHRGYRYTDDSFALPRIPATQEELLSVLLARHLLSRSAGGFLSERIRAFGDKLMADCAGFGLDESAFWIPFPPFGTDTARPWARCSSPPAGPCWTSASWTSPTVPRPRTNEPAEPWSRITSNITWVPG